MSFSDEDFFKAAFQKVTFNLGYLLKKEVILSSAKLKDAIEKVLQNDMETYVLNITSVLQKQGAILTEWIPFMSEQEKENNRNVSIAIEKLEKKDVLVCATSIIKCLESTEMLCRLMKELDQHHMAIIELEREDNKNTGKYMKIILEENLTPMKLFTILTILELIIESKIYTSTLQNLNIQGCIANLEGCRRNTEKMKILNLKMEATYTRVSSSQLYKQAGNAIVASVLESIFMQLL